MPSQGYLDEMRSMTESIKGFLKKADKAQVGQDYLIMTSRGVPAIVEMQLAHWLGSELIPRQLRTPNPASRSRRSLEIMSCAVLGQDASGTLTYEEFQAHMANPVVRAPEVGPKNSKHSDTYHQILRA